MRTYICNSCNRRIVVGHPRSHFLQKAKALAKETTSLFQRLLRRRKILTRYLRAMEDKFYLEPNRYKSLPRACPHCGFRSKGEMPWCKPGVSYSR